MKDFLYYVFAINLISFLYFGFDKIAAMKQWWRVRESILMTLAVMGGSVGCYLGMKVFHHKTLHNKFRYGIPAIFIVQVLLVAFYFLRYH